MRSPDRFFHSVSLSRVTLRVRDLDRAAAFYRDALGLRTGATGAGLANLHAPGGDVPLIVLEHAPEAPRRPAGSAGLFHVALLHPDRASLGRAVRVLRAGGVPFAGGDHGVSEAIYLADPEGNGIELYADRPAELWPRSPDGNDVRMSTDPLDLDSLLRAAERGDEGPGPAGVRVGHVHLAVSDLAAAERFYSGILGFPVRQRTYPGALFFGRDGYHHHLAVNTWRSGEPARRGALGLARFGLTFREPEPWRRVADTLGLEREGAPPDASGSRRIADPDGIEIDLAGPGRQAGGRTGGRHATRGACGG